MAAVQRNPKDSMKSTWRSDRSQWGFHHYMIHLLGINSADITSPAPVHQKNAPMPYLPGYYNHRWVLAHAFWPMILHQLYVWTTGKNFNLLTAFIFYAVAFKLNGIHELRMLRTLGQKYGFLDGDKHSRDEVPDHSVPKIMHSLVLTASLRPLMSLFLAWRNDQTPLNSLSPWVILEIGVYGIVLDFYYYWYHRFMHANDGLWKYHRTHHLTKHPNPLLTLYADEEQEFFDIVGIPFLTWGTMKLMGLPMGFFDWWVCYQYIVYTELWGHSGIRVFSVPPSTLTYFLRAFGAELFIEDHDLHHRKGWKHSHNYGKVTQLWDKIFGTTHERYESLPENINYNDKVVVPLF